MLMLEGKEREESKMTGHPLDVKKSRRNMFSKYIWPSSRSENADGTLILEMSKLKKSQNP